MSKKSINIKFVKEYTETVFGFDVHLKNIEIVKDETHGEYALIDYRELAKKVLKSLILSESKLTGAKLRFARKQIKKSLGELAQYLNVTHSKIKKWEDLREDFVGMSDDQERLFRSLCVKIMVREEEDELEKAIRATHFTEEDKRVVL